MMVMSLMRITPGSPSGMRQFSMMLGSNWWISTEGSGLGWLAGGGGGVQRDSVGGREMEWEG